VVPVREELSRTEIRVGTVTGADPERSELRYTPVVGDQETLGYDHLVVALGSVARVLPVPGLVEHGVGFKTIAEAIELRNRALRNLEIAEHLEDSELRREYLTFVFVGAGYAGLEGIAELQDYVADLLERYPRAQTTGTRWVVVEAADRVMQEIQPRLADFARAEMEARGIEFRTGTRLGSMDERSATLSSGEMVATRTLCWTAGVKPPPVVERLGLPTVGGGRIDTGATLQVRGFPNVWAVGDAAAVPDPAQGGSAPCPPTAQHALRQGEQAARNVAAVLRGATPAPFRYRTRGVFVDLGHYEAVASLMGLQVRGLPAWFAARTYHLLMMPGVPRKLRLMADWTIGLVFGRDSSELGQLGHPARLGGTAGDPDAPRP